MAQDDSSGGPIHERRTVGELFKGAYRSAAQERHLESIEDRALPAVTTLPYDLSVARVFGKICADLERSGNALPDADLQIAATALYHDLDVYRHFLYPGGDAPALGPEFAVDRIVASRVLPPPRATTQMSWSRLRVDCGT